MAISKITPVTSSKSIPANGPARSEDIRNFMQEVTADFSEIERLWNTYLSPLLDSLPGGNTVIPNDSRTSSINAFRNGLDGSQVYVDNNSTVKDTNADILYSTTLRRPLTLKESLVELKRQLTTITTEGGLLDVSSLQDRVEDLESDRHLGNQIPAIEVMTGEDPGNEVVLIPVCNQVVKEIDSITEPGSYPGILVISFGGTLPRNSVRSKWQLAMPSFISELLNRDLYVVDEEPDSDTEWTFVTDYPSRDSSLSGYALNDLLIYREIDPKIALGSLTSEQFEAYLQDEIQYKPVVYPTTIIHPTVEKTFSLQVGVPGSTEWRQVALYDECSVVDLVTYLPYLGYDESDVPETIYYGLGNLKLDTIFSGTSLTQSEACYRLSYSVDSDSLQDYSLEDLVIS